MKLDYEPDLLTPAEQAEFNALRKELFSDLIDAYGGQIAVAKKLKCSQQYVSQMKSRKEEHARVLPRWEQIWVLENALGRPVFFAGLAEAVAPSEAQHRACLIEETAEVSVAASNAVQTIARMKSGKASPEEGRAAIETVKRELAEAEAAFEAQSNVVNMKGAA